MTEDELIKQTIQHYINGAKSGKGNDMKPAFHDNATIFGYIVMIYFQVQYKNFMIGTIIMGRLQKYHVNSRVLM